MPLKQGDAEAEAGGNGPEEKVEETKDDGYEPLPLIKTGVSVAADMRFGWKPQQEQVSGAPIPLHYDFETIELPRDPWTGKAPNILFLGQRLNTSLLVHKRFANLEPDMHRDGPAEWNPKFQDRDPSYHFKFPLQIAYMLPHTYDDDREFVGMNPNMNIDNELIFDSAFESGNLDLVYKTKPNEYELFMRVDTNTRGHHQWFYFSVETPENFGK